jgi:rubrerythrin
MLDEVFKVLGVDKLDESQQVAISEKIETMIDVKSRERADELLKEEKEALVEEYETKFEDYKKDITSKFSDFVDSVLDEELEIPEKVLEYAKKGELYSELIEQFKMKLAIDEGYLTDEVKGLLKEAKEEILKLKKEVNSYMVKEMELKEDAKLMASQLYLRKKCDGLTESQKQKVTGLLEGVTDKSEIDKKFKYIVESILNDAVAEDEGTAEAASNVNVCPKCGAIYSFEGENSTGKCPKCGAQMEDAKASPEPAATNGNGHVDLQPEMVKESVVNESTSPFDLLKSSWVKILKENKI